MNEPDLMSTDLDFKPLTPIPGGFCVERKH